MHNLYVEPTKEYADIIIRGDLNSTVLDVIIAKLKNINKKKMEKRYRILEIGIDLDGGGTDRYMYNYCTRIEDIDFEFASVISKDGMLEKTLKEQGYKVHKYPRMKSGLYANFKAYYNIIKNGHFDVVHAHLCNWSFVSMFAAMLCGVKVRIAHAHFANVPETKKQHLLRRISTWLTKLFATDLAACGDDAGKWMWGEKYFNSGKVVVHNNAIESNRYRYDSHKRKIKRQEFDIGNNTLVVGHVGRISEQKNQIRLVHIFNSIHKKVPNSILLMAGHACDDYPIDAAIKELGLMDSVKMLGTRSDVSELLNAMDVFVFPSLFEGLPFTLVETQCNGLPCVCSDTVTSQIKFTDLIYFLSLNDSDEQWAKTSVEAAQGTHKADSYKYMITAGYDLNTQSSKLKDYYLERIKSHE